MNITEIVLIALGLAMDCFAVSISCSLGKNNISRLLAVKIALFFGLFQGLMPVAGWLLGLSFKNMMSGFDHWIAFGLLSIIGIKMIVEAFKKEEERDLNIRKTMVLISLSVATSIDAMVVGISFALLKLNMLLTLGIIGIVTFIVSLVGIYIGKKFTFISAGKAAIIGGLVLIGIGTKILIEHLNP
ncbi:MAG TPA: manganese efflux pump MntP family protein [Bacteroidales bacterium]|mgnify:CR=1 FL=1|jgi:putative Mn2+ efflux pump MntP|nr:manganese efflux pump [Bacteroidales bacterium]HNZ42337.1 manganese efflux pump MntP family protein [Bacteroidales bacterium]HOH83138.1 manganese efflux pump MntP family protein [Bacteroidales bacterium]HPB24823.1 manganese efflux pump MntP family protein [Bacteroidales bacterium]HPI29725.1 manganese efflux pump MntP family protein [Bacteroidales bacterium]